MGDSKKDTTIIKIGILNYLKSLRYYLTPIGCLAIGFVLGLSVAVPFIINRLNQFSNEIINILGSKDAAFSFEEATTYIINNVNSLDWNNSDTALKTLLNGDYIKELILNSLKAGINNYEGVKESITSSINNTLNAIVGAIIFFIIVLFIGLSVGIFITKIQVRKITAERKIWKQVVINIVDSIINATIVALFIYLMSLWKGSIFISTFLYILLYGAISIFEAFLVHGYKKIQLKEVLNISNILLLFLTQIIIYLIALSFSTILTVLTNQIAGIFISLPIILIAIIVNSLNAESYVKKVAENS